MKREAFEVVKVQQKSPGSWLVDGRAYSDINLGDSLATSSSPYQELRVVGIVTYGKNTDMLSTMMTGTLALKGNFYMNEGDKMFLYFK